MPHLEVTLMAPKERCNALNIDLASETAAPVLVGDAPNPHHEYNRFGNSRLLLKFPHPATSPDQLTLSGKQGNAVAEKVANHPAAQTLLEGTPGRYWGRGAGMGVDPSVSEEAIKAAQTLTQVVRDEVFAHHPDADDRDLWDDPAFVQAFMGGI